MERKTKVKLKEAGITLVALVVTIIVLLVLAGVTISLALNNNGIIQRSKDASETWENATRNEEEMMGEMSREIEILAKGNGNSNTSSYAGLSAAGGDATLPSGVTELALADVQNENLKDTTKIKAVIKGTGTNNNDEVPIPVGAKYKTGTENTGVVIEYSNSEFVWVPVSDAIYDASRDGNLPKTSSNSSVVEGYNYTPMAINTGTEELPAYKGLLYKFNSTNGGAYLCTNSSSAQYPYQCNYAEPVSLQYRDFTQTGFDLIRQYITGYSEKTDEQIESAWDNQLQDEYKNMVTSVEKYGGFYVGRYESSLDGTTVASISGTLPITAETTSGGTWYGVYQKCKNFSGDSVNSNMQSSMIWGCQWDAILNWVSRGNDKTKVNSTTIGNHSGTVANTGATATDIMNNIYDLGGNLQEWTLEGYGPIARVDKGGIINDSSSYAGCTGSYYKNVDGNDSDVTSRLILYIK